MTEKTTTVMVRFTAKTKYSDFTDAIYYPIDSPMTEEQIDAEIARRVAKFEYIIENPSQPEE